MIPTTQKTHLPTHKNKMVKLLILIIASSVLLLITASRITPAYSSNAPIVGNVQVEPSLTPTAAARATSTSERPATQTTTPSAPSAATVNVSGYFVNLRTGPDLNLTVIRKLPYGEPLVVLGRLIDNSWLYVNTPDRQEGWIKTEWVDLAGINIENQAIKTPLPPETTVKVSGESVNLRAGPSTKFSKVRKLTYGEMLILLGRLSDNSWFFVKTSDGLEGWIITTGVELGRNYKDYDSHPVITPPPTETSTPVVLAEIESRWIDIDLSEQKLYAYEGTNLVASFLVSTGIDRYPTETGQYHIKVKWRYSVMRGEDYYLPDVPFTMYYQGDFSIHGTYWHHSFGTPMSHGCVNMDTNDAEWLYNWASVGTLVNIHR